MMNVSDTLAAAFGAMGENVADGRGMLHPRRIRPPGMFKVDVELKHKRKAKPQVKKKRKSKRKARRRNRS